jgi:hypothetical protein
MYIEKELDYINYLVDENNNRVNIRFYTKEEAIKMLDSLDDCEDCIDCKNCRNCKDCIDCKDCFATKNSKNCINCTNCYECKNCINCVDCDMCECCDYCKNSKDCFKCDHCEDSKDLKNCAGCIKCSNCEYLYLSSNSKNVRLRESIYELDNFDVLNVEDRENLKKEIKSIYFSKAEYDEDDLEYIKEQKQIVRRCNLIKMNEWIKILRDSEHLLLSENYCDEYLEKYLF